MDCDMIYYDNWLLKCQISPDLIPEADTSVSDRSDVNFTANPARFERNTTDAYELLTCLCLGIRAGLPSCFIRQAANKSQPIVPRAVLTKVRSQTSR